MTTGSDTALWHFSRGIPPPEAIPAERLAGHAIDVVLDDPAPAFQYAPLGRHRGDDRLRAQLAFWHRADPDSVFVGNGSLQVLDLLAGLLLRDGPPLVFTEAPSYDRALQIFQRHGAQVVGVRIEPDGIDVAALRAQVRHQRAAFLYTIPDFQNPSGVTMSTPKRQALVRLAAEHQLTIVEDTPYRELRYHGPTLPALAELARPELAGAELAQLGPGGEARVVTVGSLSKVLSPGLRIGYAISDPHTASALAALAEATYLSPPPLCQSIAANALDAGLLPSNIARIRDVLRPRHDAAVAAVRDAFGPALIAVPDGGYFIGLLLGLRAPEAELLSLARDHGVVLTRGSVFYPPSAAASDERVFVRLPFHALSPQEFAAGLECLATVVDRLNQQGRRSRT